MPKKVETLNDLKFLEVGRLRAIAIVGANARGMTQVECECGDPPHKTIVMTVSDFHSGGRLSCGCLKAEKKKVGKQYGQLIVLSQFEDRSICKCLTCGREDVEVSTGDLRKRKLGCLGCAQKAHTERMTTHGLRGHKLYGVWSNMMQRTYNPNNPRTKDYLEAGVTVCEEWQTFEGFYAWAIVGYKEGLTLDRFPDPHGSYHDGNCRWATVGEQNNNKREHVYVTINRKRYTLAEAVEKFSDLDYDTVWMRISRGMTALEALFVPKQETMLIAYQGEEYTIRELAELFSNLPEAVVRKRLELGWDIERALTEPSHRED